MSGFFDVIGTIVSGGATGLLGAAVNTAGEYVKQKQEHKFKLEKIKEERATLEAESKMKIQELQTQGVLQTQLREDEVFQKSFSMDKRTYSSGKLKGFHLTLMVFVDFFRGIIRPSITTYMVFLTTYMYYAVLQIVGGFEKAIPPEQAISMLQEITQVILYVTTTVVFWWFGVRQKKAK